MLKISNVDTYGWEAAIRGARNPMNSWGKMDSRACSSNGGCHCEAENYNDSGVCSGFSIGPNDHKLLTKLANAGPDHGKFLRMITVTMDITAPLYWWKEYDTYKVATVANSCSTMHKIHAKEFTREDFSCEHLISDEPIPGRTYSALGMIDATIRNLNMFRGLYLETKDKKYWWQLIQLLPTSYNQTRTVQVNYQVLKSMYHARRNHKLDEWHTFCDAIRELPYSELITGETADV